MMRLVRGGSWISLPGGLRAAYRLGSASATRSYDIGFRLVVRIKEKEE